MTVKIQYSLPLPLPLSLPLPLPLPLALAPTELTLLLDCQDTETRQCLATGTVLGILLGVATPASGAAAWLIVTYSYRQAKRRIVLGVGKYVKAEDLADVSDEDAASPTQDASPAQQPAGSVQMVTVSGGQALAQASSEPTQLLLDLIHRKMLLQSGMRCDNVWSSVVG